MAESTSLETHTKYFTSTLAQSILLEHSHKVLYLNTRMNSSLEHSHNVLQQNTRTKHFTKTLAQYNSLGQSPEYFTRII
jgi:hypothetical protein